jgi:hypothetical protein
VKVAMEESATLRTNLSEAQNLLKASQSECEVLREYLKLSEAGLSQLRKEASAHRASLAAVRGGLTP